MNDVSQIIQITIPNGPAINFSRVSSAARVESTRTVVAPGCAVCVNSFGVLMLCAEFSAELLVRFAGSGEAVKMYPFFVMNFSSKTPLNEFVHFINDSDRAIELSYCVVYNG
jgi:hypothetical protein